MADNYEILIQAKDQATPAVDKVGDSLDNLDKKAKNANKTLEDGSKKTKNEWTPSWAGMASAFGVGSLAADGVSRAVGAMAGFLGDSATKALEAQSNFAGYEHILHQASGASSEQINALKSQADELERVGVISGDVVMATQGTLATFNLQYDSIKKLTPAFVDMIAKERGMNATTQDATAFGNAFGMVLQGNTGALSRYGFKFDEATEKILKTGTEQERIRVLTELLDGTYQGFNETLGQTTEGKLKRLNNSLDHLKENIGNLMLQGMEPMIEDTINVGNSIDTATGKSENMQRNFYTLGNVVKGAGYILIGLGRLIGTIATIMVSGAIVVGHFSADVVRGFAKVAESGYNMVKALVAAMNGNLPDALESFNKAKESFGQVKFTFESTSKASNDMAATVSNSLGTVYDAWGKAGAAIKEGVLQEQFKVINQESKGLKEQTTGGFQGLGDAAKKAGDKFKDTASKIKDLAKDTTDSIEELTKNFIKKSTDMYESYQKKVADINAQIADQNASYAKDSAEAEKSYQDEVVASYISRQDTIASLTKQIADQKKNASEDEAKDTQKLIDLQEKLNILKIKQSEQSATTSTSSRMSLADQIKDTERAIDSLRSGGTADTTLADLQEQLTKESDLLKQYVTEFANIEELAAAERGRTELDKMKERFEAEKAERDADHQAKLAELQVKMDEEKALYEKNKQELIEETADKYAKIGEKLNEGWTKMKEDTKGHVKEMKALEEQVLAIKASIDAARSAIQGGNAPVEARANGGSVNGGQPYLVGERGPELFVPNTSGTIVPNGGATQIHIMENANVSLANQSDVNALTDQLASRLAQVLQQQRNGLATSS